MTLPPTATRADGVKRQQLHHGRDADEAHGDEDRAQRPAAHRDTEPVEHRQRAQPHEQRDPLRLKREPRHLGVDVKDIQIPLSIIILYG